MSTNHTTSTLRRLVLVAAVLLVLGAGSPHVAAEAPRQQGWWTVSNPSRVALPPEIDPGAPLPPAPPDVPEDGLLVQGGPEDSSDLPGGIGGPSAFAALVYEVPLREAADTLVLMVAEGAASTPLAPVRVCPLRTNTIQPAQGGPMSDAPEFDCTTEVLAEPSEDGTRYEWPIAELESNGIVAVALLAAGSDDRIGFAAPDGGSLVTVPSGEAPAAPTEDPAREVATPAEPPRSPSGVPSVPRPSVTAPAPSAAAPVEEAAAPAPVASYAVPSVRPAGAIGEEFEAAAAALVILVLAAGATLWALAGRAGPEDDEDETAPLTIAPAGS